MEDYITRKGQGVFAVLDPLFLGGFEVGEGHVLDLFEDGFVAVFRYAQDVYKRQGLARGRTAKCAVDRYGLRGCGGAYFSDRIA